VTDCRRLFLPVRVPFRKYFLVLCTNSRPWCVWVALSGNVLDLSHTRRQIIARGPYEQSLESGSLYFYTQCVVINMLITLTSFSLFLYRRFSFDFSPKSTFFFSWLFTLIKHYQSHNHTRAQRSEICLLCDHSINFSCISLLIYISEVFFSSSSVDYGRGNRSIKWVRKFEDSTRSWWHACVRRLDSEFCEIVDVSLLDLISFHLKVILRKKIMVSLSRSQSLTAHKVIFFSVWDVRACVWIVQVCWSQTAHTLSVVLIEKEW
jgi:hypothetical protein